MTVRGEDHYRAELSEDEAREAKRRLANDGSIGRIAYDLDVSRECIRAIDRGLSWAWLDVEPAEEVEA